MRRTRAQIAAVSDVADALHDVAPDLAVRVAYPSTGATADLVVITRDGQQVLVDVTSAKRPTPSAMAALLRNEVVDEGLVKMMVADNLMPEVRRQLKEAGWSWLDRGGHLRFWSGPLMVDVPVRPVRDTPTSIPPLTTAASRELALLLLAEAGPVGVRQAARLLERAPSTISQAFRSLRQASLVDGAAAPVVPELFWNLAGEWGRAINPTPLARLPMPGDAAPTSQLRLGLDDPEATTGWALRGPVAAAAFGARAPLPGAYPPDFFVPDERTLHVALHLFDHAVSNDERACTIAVAPTPWIVAHRVDLAGRGLGRTEWPTVHPVVAALDLTQDPRGREVLEAFEPPAGWQRVW